jgi:recombination protein RecT
MAGAAKGREVVTGAVVARQERDGEEVQPGRQVAVVRSEMDEFLLERGKDQTQRGLAGTGIDPERFLRTVTTVVSQSSLQLAKSEKQRGAQLQSVLVAALNVATLNLSPAPQIGHVWFVPFYDSKLAAQKIQLIVGYQGFVMLAGRAAWSMKVEPIWRGQPHRINLARPEDTIIEPLERIPAPDERPVKLAFIANSGAMLTSSITARPYEWYLRGRERSESWKRDEKARREGNTKHRYGPWTTDELAMACKTALRWERKFVPMDPNESLAAARLAMGFMVDGSVGGEGELPPPDPRDAMLWTPDSYDSDEPGQPAGRMDDLSDAALLSEIGTFEAGSNCAGADISGEVDGLIAAHGLDPAVVAPILAGSEDGPVPPRELMIAVLALCRRAADDAAHGRE